MTSHTSLATLPSVDPSSYGRSRLSNRAGWVEIIGTAPARPTVARAILAKSKPNSENSHPDCCHTGANAPNFGCGDPLSDKTRSSNPSNRTSLVSRLRIDSRQPSSVASHSASRAFNFLQSALISLRDTISHVQATR